MTPSQRAKYRHLLIGRVRRNVVDGELVSITLELMRDNDVADLTGTEDDPAEFVTILVPVDLYAAR